MKQTVLMFAAILAVVFNLHAQCTPNDTVTTLVYPLPVTNANPNGGINEIACKGSPFNFTFTVNVPTTFTVSGFTANLDSAIMGTTGSVTNLPMGLSYVCNPPNCHFQANTKGCLKIIGTVAPGVPQSDFELAIAFTVYGKLFGAPVTAPITFPADTSGKYILRVREPGNCTIGVLDLPESAGELKISPVPARDHIYLFADVIASGEYRIQILNAQGILLQDQAATLFDGENRVELNIENMPNGMHWLRLIGNERQSTKPFVIMK